MEALSAIERIVRDLLVFVVAMSVVLAALMVIVSRMPNDNPLKRILVALSYRVGATAAAGMLVIPSTPIPGLDAVIDIGAPLALIWYWWTFFRDARRGPLRNPRHEIREGQRPRHPLSRPRPARSAAARFHQRARLRLAHLDRGRWNPRA